MSESPFRQPLPFPLSFAPGGVPMEDQKSSTAGQVIAPFLPTEVTIPLAQHLGPPARAIVKRKDVVAKGDPIGEAVDGGVAVHASVTGTVDRVALAPHPTLVEAPAVVITVDPTAADPLWEEVANWEDTERDTMLQRIAEAGIVGLGGAAFPTHRKLRLPPNVTIDTLIVNGAECEPYLTADHRIMLERPQDLLRGALLVARILGTSNVVIGIEDNKIDAAEGLTIAAERLPLTPRPRIALCRTRYPQGSERQLVACLTGRIVPKGKLPMHVGVMVQNVATLVACYEAIRFRRPLTDRIVTVTGHGVRHPRNLQLPLGTLARDAIEACGGLHPQAAKVIAGGPMMGRSLGRLDVPIIKGTGGLLVLRAQEVRRTMYGPCISCGRCLYACPLGLEPNQIAIYTEAGRGLETERFGTKECFECGCCSYVCPAERPLVQFIQMAKSAFQSGSAVGLRVYPGDVSQRAHG